jgi:hypothetical protein
MFEKKNGAIYLGEWNPKPRIGERIRTSVIISSATFGNGFSPPDPKRNSIHLKSQQSR